MEQAALSGSRLRSYAVVAGIAWRTNWHYPFFIKEYGRSPFRFFSNRNQTGSFLLTGAIVSLGLIYRGMHRVESCPLFLLPVPSRCCWPASVFLCSRGGVCFSLLVSSSGWRPWKIRPKSFANRHCGDFSFGSWLWLGSGGAVERLTGHSRMPRSLFIRAARRFCAEILPMRGFPSGGILSR